MKENETKLCKYCQSEIPKKAKVCPNCRKKVKGGILKWIIIVIVVIAVIAAAAGGNDKTSDTKTQTGSSESSDTKTETSNSEDDKIEYEKYDVKTLMDDLDKNALKAADKYKDQYVELTGVLGNIDSSGSYVCIDSDEENFYIINVQCFIQNDEQLEAIKELESGEAIVVKGKITDVGEALGYSLDLESIKKAK